MIKVSNIQTKYYILILVILAINNFISCSSTKSVNNNYELIQNENIIMENNSVPLIDFPALKISYRDIPGVTLDEIRAIEFIKTQYSHFSFGASLNTISINKEGEYEGFSALFCFLLTNLLGIQFIPVIYEPDSLINRLRANEIDFIIEILPIDRNRMNYFMTDDIVEYMKSFTNFYNINIGNMLQNSNNIFSLATHKPEFAPIISVIQKAIVSNYF